MTFPDKNLLMARLLCRIYCSKVFLFSLYNMFILEYTKNKIKEDGMYGKS